MAFVPMARSPPRLAAWTAALILGWRDLVAQTIEAGLVRVEV